MASSGGTGFNGEMAPFVPGVDEEVNGVQLEERNTIMITASSFVSCSGVCARPE
jgi:hypothetical protein